MGDSDQTGAWQGAGARGWIGLQTLLDETLRPFEDALVATARGAGAVLDVGCGTGGAACAAARALGPGGVCVGVDVSEAMIEAARLRAAEECVGVEFICADAQTFAFDPERFDRIISRFGVMFFEDPVAAFANLRGAAQRGAGLACVVWRGPEENPFMTAAERAAAPLLNLPERKAGEPGQFGLADATFTRAVLERSRWGEIDIAPLDVSCSFPETALVDYFTSLGPVGRALAGADANTIAMVAAAVRPAFDPYVRGGAVRFDAACWIITARAS
jgi:SAM-dependent methyltransferase